MKLGFGLSDGNYGGWSAGICKWQGVVGHRSEGDRVLTGGERSKEVPFQATGGGKPGKETLL